MLRILIAAATGALISIACAAPTPATVRLASEGLQVEWLEQQWTQAAVAADRPMLNDLLDDEFIEIFPGDIGRNKRDLLAAAPMPPGGSQVLEDVRVQVLDNVAVATGINRYTPAAGYKAIEYRFTDVFVKREGGWRVAASRMRRKETGSI
ncbi:nuclear transport factor 2 family protein [Paraburkholderia sp. A1RO-5L]|uniref:nuclear transport factor 2 family protein n=1 Tax=unclassified Paraburkholderia TaxID=2615204 RepID=UPI003B7DE6A3